MQEQGNSNMERDCDLYLVYLELYQYIQLTRLGDAPYWTVMQGFFVFMYRLQVTNWVLKKILESIE